MRIGVLVHSWLDDAEGGGNRVAHDLAHFLRRRGHEITVIVPALTSAATRDSESDGVRLVRYEWAGAEAGGLNRWQSHVREIAQTLKRIHRREPFDVLHSHAVLQSGGVLAARLPVPLVQTVHAPVMLEAPYRRAGFDRLSLVRWKLHAGDAVLHRLEGFVLRSAARITCLSKFMLDEIVRAHSWQARSIRERTSVVRGGTNLSAFRIGITRREARTALGWGNEPVIVAVRRLEPRMGLDLLLDACAELRRQLPGVARCVIAGRGSLASELKRRCQDLGLDDRVEFPGFVTETTLPYLYAAADVVVMPSVAAEGFGVTSVEALASGTPVVATPIGANLETVGSIDLRLVAEDATAPAIAKAIIRALEIPWDREELAAECLRKYDLDAAGPEYERVLRHAYVGRERMAAGA